MLGSAAPAPAPASGGSGGDEEDFRWTAGKVRRSAPSRQKFCRFKGAPAVAGVLSRKLGPSHAAHGSAHAVPTCPTQPSLVGFPAARRASRRPRPPTHPRQVVLSLALFVAAGVAEIGGGWLVWQSIRLHKGWYLAVAGAAVLFLYGVIPCAQPMDNFGRVRCGAGRSGCTCCRTPRRAAVPRAPRPAEPAPLAPPMPPRTPNFCPSARCPAGLCRLRLLLHHPVLPVGLGGGWSEA